MKLAIVDTNKINYIRDKRDNYTCIFGVVSRDGCDSGVHVHHIIPRSILHLDDERNLITLCPKHHEMAETREISKHTLFDLLAKFYRYDYYVFEKEYWEFVNAK